MVSTVHLLVNPSAGEGAGAHLVPKIVGLIEAAGCDAVTLDNSSPEASLEALDEAVADEVERIVVAGGDGMVHLAIQALAESNTTFGLIPTGTGNDFARAMGLSTDIETAVSAALGPARPIDLLRIDDTWAASIATYGFAADVNERANKMRWPKGSTRYTVATMLQIPRLKAQTVDLEIDGSSEARTSVLTTFANTSDFGGGMRISPNAVATDGQLDITSVGDIGRLQLLRFFRTVFDGSHVHHPAVTTGRASRVGVLTPGIAIRADGEAVTTSPFTIEIVANAIRLAGISTG